MTILKALLPIIFLVLCSVASSNKTNSASKSTTTSASQNPLTPPFRQKNLDHWDKATICTYLRLDPQSFQPIEPTTGTTTGTTTATTSLPDAAILLYANWCPNCHALAPIWDQVATILHAGTAQSNLIMALFDCEKNYDSRQICNAIGVTAYPTLLYVSQHAEYHDTDFLGRMILGKKAGGPMGASKLKHTVKFQGDWRYGEEFMDWIKVMGGISSWKRWSNGRKGKKMNSKDNMLPVGIPTGHTINTAAKPTSTGASVNPQTDADIEKLKREKTALTKEKDNLKQAAKHAGLLIDLTLFGVVSENKADKMDIFTTLANEGGWDATATKGSQDHYLMKTCVMDLTLDYCTRYYLHRAIYEYDSPKATASTTATSTKGSEGVNASGVANATTTAAAGSTADTTSVGVGGIIKEPYCDIIESCVIQGFKSAECKPNRCPLENEYGCRYVNSCQDRALKNEYMKALGLEQDTTTKAAGGGSAGAGPAASAQSESKDEQPIKDKPAKGGWGFK